MNRYNQGTIGIETLEETLESLSIIKEYNSYKNRTTKLALLEKISIAPIPVVHTQIVQAVMPKSMVLNPEQFDGNQTKLKDQQREI